MIERTTESSRINAILNHPAVRPWVADAAEGEIDVAPQLRSENVICLRDEHGTLLVYGYGGGIWEIHSAVLPEGRGRWAKEFAAAGVRWMFTTTDCIEIITRVPQGHIAAKALSEATGFRFQFTTPAQCLFRGERVPVHVYSLTLQEWLARASELEAEGAKFHAWLNRQVGNGQGEPHPTDPAHNRIVGAALAMALAGQFRKAVAWYNRAALAARHMTISLIGENQIRFDAGILTFADDGMIRFERAN